LRETSHLILGKEFDAILFLVGIENVRKTPSRERCHPLRVGVTLWVFAEDVMKFLLDVGEGLTMSAKILHRHCY
jgi:hypothetical protein